MATTTITIEDTPDGRIAVHSDYQPSRGERCSLAQQATLEIARTERTLQDRPWKRCDCAICRDVGVEVIIFRGSNRNKRRGFHNLGVYHRHLHRTLDSQK